MVNPVFRTLVQPQPCKDILSPYLFSRYGGGLEFASAPDNRPAVFSNFVTSLDGKVTFGGQSRPEGRLISRYSTDDQWLMGLLRASADAVVVGAGTARAEGAHTWTVDSLGGAEKEHLLRWREESGRPAHPLQCIVSNSGQLDTSAAVFQRNDLRVLVFTTSGGAGVMQQKGVPKNTRVIVTENEGLVDLEEALGMLRQEFGVKNLLTEGGPHFFADLLKLEAVDDVFQTLSPLLAGNSPNSTGRYSLVEGQSFTPESAPDFSLISLRTGIADASHLFLHYRRRRSR